MDKYRREDDPNDDLGVYNSEQYEGMSVHSSERSFTHQLRVFGKTEEEKEVLQRVKNKKSLLSPQELELLRLIVEEGESIRHAARRMKIRQQTASGYWRNIQEKMK